MELSKDGENCRSKYIAESELSRGNSEIESLKWVECEERNMKTWSQNERAKEYRMKKRGEHCFLCDFTAHYGR